MGNTADLAGVAKLRVNNNNNKRIVSLQLHIFTLKYCYWKPAYAQYIAHIILLCPFVLAAEE